MPSWAPRPVPVSRPTGVARPSAHGQAITSTATAAVKAARKSASVIPGAATNNQVANVSTAITNTMGTKTALTRSASRAIGALPVCAWETRRPICASVVSEPTRVARTSRRPEVLSVAPVTTDPSDTSTGTDSPVTSEVSTAEAPSITTPSVAIFSPGRTTMTSPTASFSAAILCSTSSTRTVASLAPSANSALSALPAFCLELASRYRPSSRKVVIPTRSREQRTTSAIVASGCSRK